MKCFKSLILSSSLVLVALSLSVLSPAALAAKSKTAPQKTMPAKPAAETLAVDAKGSTVRWNGSKVAGKHTGTVAIKEGSLKLEAGKPAGGNFIIDLATIANDDLKDPTYNAKLTNHLKSDDFFAVSKFPTAELKINKLTPGAADQYTVNGDLTIKGITKPVTFPAKITNTNGAYMADAKFKINRLDWDIKYNSGKFFDPKTLGDKMINDDIEFELAVKTTIK